MALRFHRGPGLPEGTPLAAFVRKVNEWLIRLENVFNALARIAEDDHLALAALDVVVGAADARTEWLEAARSLALLPTRAVCVQREDATTYKWYRHLGGRYWARGQFSTGGVAGGPYSWNETRLFEIMSFVTAPDAACLYAGAWDALPFLGSGDPAKYVGGRSRQASVAGPTVTVTFTGSGDLFAVYTGRTNGAYIKATLDGATENCDALPLHASGYRYFDAYTAVDLTWKQAVKVASNLAAGSHTLVLEVMADKNPSSAGNRLIFEAIGIAGDTAGLPYQSNTRPPAYPASGTVVPEFYQIQVSGRNYYCSTAGTTAGVTPTGTTSGVPEVDGTAQWSYMTSSSYALLHHRFHAVGSQVEYAYEIKPTGAGSFEDVGGVLHGNETLVSATWYVDGRATAAPAVGDWLVGGQIALEQAIEATHSFTGVTPVNSTTLRHTIHRDRLNVAYTFEWEEDGVLGFCYPHMWPLLAYSVEAADTVRWTMDYAASPQGGTFSTNDYSGVSATYFGRTEDYVMAEWGDVMMTNGVGIVPSSDLGPMTALCLLIAHPVGLNWYEDASNLRAAFLTNTSGATTPGINSHTVKMYMERTARGDDVPVAAGEVWRASADYHVLLAPGSSVAFPPA